MDSYTEGEPRVLSAAQAATLDQPMITLAEHAAIASSVIGRPISEKTVQTYHQWSQPTRAGRKTTNRYERDPMPRGLHVGVSVNRAELCWLRSQESDIRRWWHKQATGALDVQPLYRTGGEHE